MSERLTLRSVCYLPYRYRITDTNNAADIEDVSQQLIEDNIIAVSRQMIDKEASVARPSENNGAQHSTSMEMDEEL